MRIRRKRMREANMTEELRQIIADIKENDKRLLDAIEDAKERLNSKDKKILEDLENDEKIITLLEDRAKEIDRLLASKEVMEQRHSVLKIDEAVEKFKAGGGKLDFGKLMDAVIKYPISTDVIAKRFGFESEEDFIGNMETEPIGTINWMLPRYYERWEAGESQLRNINTIGNNAEKIDGIFERWKMKTPNMISEEEELYKVKGEVITYAEVCIQQSVDATAMLIVLLFPARHFIDEIERLRDEFGQWQEKVNGKEEEFNDQKKKKQQQMEEFEEGQRKEKRNLETLKEHIEGSIAQLEKREKELVANIEKLEKQEKKIKKEKGIKDDDDEPEI